MLVIDRICSRQIINIEFTMKKFRSSKVLKPIDPQTKQQFQLRSKIKNLEEQVEMLQKSNLNIFIPISEHTIQPKIDYEALIRQLKQKIGSLENQNQTHKNTIKKLEREKEQIKKEYHQQLQNLHQKIASLESLNLQLKQTITELEEQLDHKKKENEELQTLLIEKNVQLKFMAEQLHQEKLKTKTFIKKVDDLNDKINAVIYSSRVHKSLEAKCICLLKTQYDDMKQKIAALEAEIQKYKNAQHRQIVTLGTRKSDIGEEIVRLKKNIDVQLGLQGNSKHSDQFLKVYQSTHHLLENLLQKCKT